MHAKTVLPPLLRMMLLRAFQEHTLGIVGECNEE